MNKILKKIIKKTEKDLIEKKKSVSQQELKKQINNQNQSGLFYKAITHAVNNPAIIAEVKFASPSAGTLVKSGNLFERAKLYESAGADAISVITEMHFFKGNINFINQVKNAVSLPVLQKDFIIDEYQIYEAANTGSDALLLIARLLDKITLKKFVDKAIILGIEPVVEVYAQGDLEIAVASKTRFIAANSRDLDTFEVNVDKACSILKKRPDKFIRLGFSGIESASDVVKYKDAGARGVLIGTSLMKTGNVEEFIEGIKL
jgi:indole-3-glycerol phosphate synthase